MDWIITLLALLAGIFSPAPIMPVQETPLAIEKDFTRGFAPCKYEDSEGPCYWDAENRNNGEGLSFTVLQDGTIEYWGK